MKKILVSWAFFVFLCLALASVVSAASHLEKTIDPLLGTKYKWGGNSPEGFDCSGFTQYVFAQYHIQLPHSSKGQAEKGYWIPKDQLRPGDLVFFNTSGKGISHVGIYLGNGEFVHADSSKGVMKNQLSEDYYEKRYVSARRITWQAVYDHMMATVDPKQ